MLRSITSEHTRAFAYVAWMVCASLYSSVAAPQVSLEPAVKAAYIYRFLEYVSWPPQVLRSPDAPIVIGTTQPDDVVAELNRIASERTVQNRRISVIQVKDERDAAIHVLYVPRLDGPRAKVLEVFRQRPVLIITDAADGLERGATINFVESDGRIKFEVSVDAASRAGLTISSRLLAVAARVKKSEYSPLMFSSTQSRNIIARLPRDKRPFQGNAEVVDLFLGAT